MIQTLDNNFTNKIIPVLEISCSLVSKKTDEGNEGSTAGDCTPGGVVAGGPDFSADAEPIKMRAFSNV